MKIIKKSKDINYVINILDKIMEKVCVLDNTFPGTQEIFDLYDFVHDTKMHIQSIHKKKLF